MEHDLNQLRVQIDSTDKSILQALAARRKLTRQVIETKAEKGLRLRDEGREEELLARLIAEGRELGLDAHYVTRIFQEVVDDSVRSQQRFLLEHGNDNAPSLRRVAFQGIEGAYSHLAAKKQFSEDLARTTFIGYPTFVEVVDAVEEKKADCAFLPVENTTAGSINEVYDLLSRAQLSIVGEEVFPVDHCLLAPPGAKLHELRRILSHPMALAQCMKFISNLRDCLAQPFADTAMAVRKVSEDADVTQGAIASEEAGRSFGLTVLKRNLADQRDNYTRFLVVQREPIQVDPRIPAKTSLIVATSHEEGSLLEALRILHDHQINLTKLESRPRPGMPFQYNFYLDFEGNLVDENVVEALAKLRGATVSMKVLGCYPIEQRSRTMPGVRSRIPRRRAGHEEEAQASEDTAASAAKVPAKPADPYDATSRVRKRENTIVNVRGVKIGAGDLVVIAGPSSVESREQLFACAHQVKECGGLLLRGGCYEASAAPATFEGLGTEGLKILAEASTEYDLPVVTEVISPGDVATVASFADVLQISSRNMQNLSLLAEVGKANRPVLLKRGMVSTLDELLAAAEYILQRGNHQVILCERGVRTFETSTRNTLDLGAIPILRQRSHLPILVDPSNAAGERELVAPLALAAQAVQPDGMLIEIHPQPEKALNAGRQALDFEAFADLMRQLYAV